MSFFSKEITAKLLFLTIFFHNVVLRVSETRVSLLASLARGARERPWERGCFFHLS